MNNNQASALSTALLCSYDMWLATAVILVCMAFQNTWAPMLGVVLALCMGTYAYNRATALINTLGENKQ